MCPCWPLPGPICSAEISLFALFWGGGWPRSRGSALKHDSGRQNHNFPHTRDCTEKFPIKFVALTSLEWEKSSIGAVLGPSEGPVPLISTEPSQIPLKTQKLPPFLCPLALIAQNRAAILAFVPTQKIFFFLFCFRDVCRSHLIALCDSGSRGAHFDWVGGSRTWPHSATSSIGSGAFTRYKFSQHGQKCSTRKNKKKFFFFFRSL